MASNKRAATVEEILGLGTPRKKSVKRMYGVDGLVHTGAEVDESLHIDPNRDQDDGRGGLRLTGCKRKEESAERGKDTAS